MIKQKTFGASHNLQFLRLIEQKQQKKNSDEKVNILSNIQGAGP